MVQASLTRRGRRLLLAALIAAGALLGAQAPRTSTLAHAADSAAKPRPKFTYCAWNTASIGQERFGNRGYIDTDASYLLMRWGWLPGRSLRITGQFPYARFMSITVYAGRAGVVVDHLIDSQIVPDKGSTNPFRPFANRQATRRSYTIYIQQGSIPPSGRAPNTLYTGPYHPVRLMYRVYAPDQGADNFGNAPKPRVDILNGTPKDHSGVTPMATCASPRPTYAQPNISLPQPLRWRRLGAFNGPGINADESYLQVRINHDDADEYVIRFKEPTFANTYIGNRITGREDVRFWSVCQYDMSSTIAIACLHDYQAVRSRSGYVTVVISTLANRPSTATRANGVNWLPFGRQQAGVVIYRQLLPSATFQNSIQNVAPDALPFEMRRDMGRYFPIIETCSVAGYTPTSCSDALNPGLCSDLTEPAQCGSGQTIDRRLPAVAARRRATR